MVFCDNCEKIVGSINKAGYRYLNIAFICTCGNFGSIEVIRDGHYNDITKQICNTPKTKMGVYCCTKCDMPLISMIDERVQNYSFYTECVCGERFDTKPAFDKRLGETLKAIKKLK